MAEVRGIGNFVPWDGGCLLVSRALGVTPMHAHYAIQIAFGSEPGIRFRTRDTDPWGEFGGVVIASRQPHTMDATVVRSNAVLFIEPETREGRALAERFPHDGISPIPGEVLRDLVPALFAAWHEERSAAALEAAARRVVFALTGGVEPSVVSDPRILRAIAYIKANIGSALDLDTVAREAFLSPGRFRHLFVEQTGMGLRPYIQWRRFLRVWELVMHGASLSAAAHEAGFADAAHFSRTSRSLFGLAPSSIQFLEPLRDTHAERSFTIAR